MTDYQSKTNQTEYTCVSQRPELHELWQRVEPLFESTKQAYEQDGDLLELAKMGAQLPQLPSDLTAEERLIFGKISTCLGLCQSALRRILTVC